MSTPAASKEIQVQFDRILANLIKQTRAGFAALQLLSSTPGNLLNPIFEHFVTVKYLVYVATCI